MSQTHQPGEIKKGGEKEKNKPHPSLAAMISSEFRAKLGGCWVTMGLVEPCRLGRGCSRSATGLRSHVHAFPQFNPGPSGEAPGSCHSLAEPQLQQVPPGVTVTNEAPQNTGEQQHPRCHPGTPSPAARPGLCCNCHLPHETKH